MQNWKKFSRTFLFILLFIGLCAGLVAPRQERAQAAPKQAAALAVVINEVAWAGNSAAFSSDEWIELYNTTGAAIPLAGWTLSDGGDINISFLSGSIPAGGYYLLERDDDNTISDLAADYIYTGGLTNNPTGETLTLTDGSSTIDTANISGSGWDAGSTYFSMERKTPIAADSATEWVVNNGVIRNGLAADTLTPINGTPRSSKIDLSLTMTVDNPTQSIGGTVIFIITVSNINNVGYSAATNVTVKDLLPAGLTVDPLNPPVPSVGAYDPVTTGIWTVGSLPVGTSATLTITAKVAASGSKTNFAEVWASAQGDADSTPGNSSTTEDDDANVTVVPPGNADLSLTNDVNNPTPLCATSVVFTVTVANNVIPGNTATNVKIKTKLPVGLTYVSNDGGAVFTPYSPNPAPGGEVDWNVNGVGGALSSGSSATIHITATVSNTAATIWAEVWASDQLDPDSIIGNVSTTEDDDDDALVTPNISCQADLSLSQTWNRSTSTAGIAQLNITVKNNDPVNPATNVQVKDLLPSGLNYVSHSSGITYNSADGIWLVGTVLANGVSTLTINVRPAADGTGTNNFAEIWWSDQFDSDSTPGNGDTGEDDDTNPTVSPPGSEVLVADLTLLQTVNIAAGVGVFTITVKNNGPDDASGVVVKNSILANPAKYIYVSHGSTAGTIYYKVATPAPIAVPSAVAGEWRIPTLPDGATVTLVVTVTSASSTFEKNTAEIVAVNTIDPDSLPNNCLSIGACNEDDNFAAPIPLADLYLTHTVDDDNPDPQDVFKNNNNLVTFTITVKNLGPNSTTGVKIVDLLPTGLTYISPVTYTPSVSGCAVTISTGMTYSTNGVWNIGTLDNNACAEINITAKSITNGKFTNTAKVFSAFEKDPNPYNNYMDVALITHRAVIINEVAWAGTLASEEDEWIELYNPSPTEFLINGWVLQRNQNCTAASNFITLASVSGKLVKSGYYLLERDSSATTTVVEDQVYPATTLKLDGAGETLFLCDDKGNFIDTANFEGYGNPANPWPAGGKTSHSDFPSMERQAITPERDSDWITNGGVIKNGRDANNDVIYGTPKSVNSTPPVVVIAPTATLAPPLDRLIINEFLARPGYDWNQDGKVDVFDEFIEIKNIGITTVKLNGWQLDDEEDAGSAPVTFSDDIVLKPGDRVVYYGLQTNILLSDGGDTVRLINTKGKVFDNYTYFIVKVEDQSVCRLPDGNGSWYEDCIPTPALINTREGTIPAMGDESYQSPVCSLPDTLPVDFLFAECRGYGANIWRMVWDSGWLIIPDDDNKWITFVE